MKKLLLSLAILTAVLTAEARVMVYSLLITNITTRSDTGQAYTEVFAGRLVFNPRAEWPIGLPGQARTILSVERDGATMFGIDCVHIDNGWPFVSKKVTRLTLTWGNADGTVVSIRGANTRLKWTVNGYISYPQILRGTIRESWTDEGVTFTSHGTVVAKFLPAATRAANKQLLNSAVTAELYANTLRLQGFEQVSSCE